MQKKIGRVTWNQIPIAKKFVWGDYEQYREKKAPSFEIIKVFQIKQVLETIHMLF